MERFARMLQRGFTEKGIQTEIWRPENILGKFGKTAHAGLGKWLGYIDKWILFPFILKWRRFRLKEKGQDIRFHVCDHSNAPYRRQLPPDKTAITCHDVLAIRGALGHADAYCPASGTGKLLQKWILGNLIKYTRIAAVSQLTLDQLKELSNGKTRADKKDWQVIYNAFNAEFKVMDPSRAFSLLKEAGLDPAAPFMLHVGSRLPRKNRKLLLDITARAGDRWNGRICFAGQPLDDDLIGHAKDLGLWERVISVEKPGHDVLVALYSSCFAFVFPSFSEGFGWPVIEAQACGAPVIASSAPPMPEISGGAALHASPHDASAFADALVSLQEPALRKTIIHSGLQNITRFDFGTIVNAYVALHDLKPVNAL